MSFVKYQNTNNASSLLIADITASQTTILITDGDQGLFPSSFPFLLTIEHLDASENVILREIVKVVSSNQNSFTVERSAGICVQDDTATNRVQDNTAHAFYSGDKISLYWTAEQVADIQNNLELKANQDSIANVYDNTATYSVGDIVVYKGDRYVCSTAVETAEDFDSTKWTKINVQYTLDNQQSQIDDIEEQISGLGGVMKVDVLVLGGGGAGGGTCGAGQGGGGGAGQLKIIEGFPIRSKVQTITIGSGGTARVGRGNQGGVSKFGYLVSLGGGGGGFNNLAGETTGGEGANGGGGSGGSGVSMKDRYGGISTVPGGMPGLPGGCSTVDSVNGGGGGGVGGPNILDPTRGYVCLLNYGLFPAGGLGIATCFGGTVLCIGGGGGTKLSGSRNQLCISSLCFGGGETATSVGYGGMGCPGCPNTGGGGGGAYAAGGSVMGGDGGSGLVIVRYPTDCSYGIKTATGGTITTATIDGIPYKIHTFTNSGTFEITESV